MPYRFRAGERVGDAVIRIGREQIARAIDEIDDADLPPAAIVHMVRKRCKKLRGLFRIVRPSLATYGRENDCFRDAARLLSGTRDARSIVDCVDGLIHRHRHGVEPDALAALRERLVDRRRQAEAGHGDIDRRLERVREVLQGAYVRAATWQVEGDGFAALAGGLKKTYKRGREAVADVRQSPSDGGYHTWRKRVKYHGYHLRLLSSVWKDVMKCHRQAASALGDRLGDDHDLAMLRQVVLAEPVVASDSERALLLELIRERRVELQRQAFSLGERLFAETPGALVARLGGYWDTWQWDRQPAPPEAQHPARRGRG